VLSGGLPARCWRLFHLRSGFVVGRFLRGVLGVLCGVLGAHGGDGGLEKFEGRSEGGLDSVVAERGGLEEEVEGLPTSEGACVGKTSGSLLASSRMVTPVVM
jgi:hypothetical protein